jgi:AcrR family transcriptional regulator
MAADRSDDLSPTAPLPRAQQQERTRAALVDAAATVFAREGFHAASLDEIAAAAGFTKGAVYSNFANKAGLYLAVLDRTIDRVVVSERSVVDDYAEEVARGERSAEEVEAAIRGEVLASLEFVAAAMRDDELAAQLDERIERLRQAFVGMAGRWRAPDDPLTAEDIGTLAFAFQQGIGLAQGLGIALPAATIEEAFARLATARDGHPTDAPAEGPTDGPTNGPTDGPAEPPAG